MSQTRSSDRSPGSPRRLSILGSTGSIGTQTLEVVRLFPDRFEVDCLSCGSNIQLLADQIREFEPKRVAVGTEEKANALREMVGDRNVDIRTGEEGLCTVASEERVDVVMAAVVGFAGLAPVLAALNAGKTVALANKETLVVGGGLVRDALDGGEGRLLPVDSEHSAIFQCLVGESEGNVENIVLTASGGPFRTRPAEAFGDITVEEALDHPNWSMGPKITIDSSTMMNKGLEVIEARWLFDLAADQIEVLVHPQSIVHSMVAFKDGSLKAQLGVPDMKVPIQYALSFPRRWPAPHERLDWSDVTRLDFERPDTSKFPCLRLAYEALEVGGTAPTVLNGANEAAVQLFLDKQISFVEIPRVIERTLDALPTDSAPTLDELYAADADARQHVEELATARSN